MVTDSAINHCSKKVAILCSGTWLPQETWLITPPAPKSSALRTRKTASRMSRALTGRLDLPPPHPTPKCYSAAVPGRMFLEFLLRPLGVNRVDANFHEIIQGLAGCAFAKEEHEFIVPVKHGTVFPEKRLEQRSPDLQVCAGGRNPGQIITENHAVDLGSCPKFDLLAKELVQPGKQCAKVLVAVAKFADGSFRAAQLAEAVQRPHFAAARA